MASLQIIKEFILNFWLIPSPPPTLLKVNALYRENTDYNGMSREEDNTNITAFINRSEIKLSFDVNELVYVNFNWKISILNVITTLTSTCTVLLVNALVLLMLKMKENTLVDRMVLLDCLANISTIGVMFLAFPIRVWGNTYFCLLVTFFRGFVVVLNRLTIHYCCIGLFLAPTGALGVKMSCVRPCVRTSV